jgi:hypothetical protein
MLIIPIRHPHPVEQYVTAQPEPPRVTSLLLGDELPPGPAIETAAARVGPNRALVLGRPAWSSEIRALMRFDEGPVFE